MPRAKTTEPKTEERVRVEIVPRRESEVAKVYVGTMVNGKFQGEFYKVNEPVEMYPTHIKSLEARMEFVRVENKKTRKNHLVQKPIYTISPV